MNYLSLMLLGIMASSSIFASECIIRAGHRDIEPIEVQGISVTVKNTILGKRFIYSNGLSKEDCAQVALSTAKKMGVKTVSWKSGEWAGYVCHTTSTGPRACN